MDILTTIGVTIISSLITSGTVWVVLQARYKHSLDKKLESHKQELTVHAKMLEFENSRKKQDFDLWTKKRHEAYASVSEAAVEAQSRIFTLRGYGRVEDFAVYSKEEIEAWLRPRKFLQQDIERVLSIWDTDRERPLMSSMSYGASKRNTWHGTLGTN